MSNFDDSSSEMHDDTLSAEEVEALIEGSSARPDLGELETLFAEVRALPNRTESPKISAALAEFVGVDLTPNPEPIVLGDVDETIVLTSSAAPSAQPVRRNSMIGQAAAFLGTIGGKVVVGTTVAAASLGGAHATGAVDVPYLPDNKPAQIETIDLPEDPDALAFVDDLVEEDEVGDAGDKELESNDVKEEPKEEAKPDAKPEKKDEADEAQFIEDDFPTLGKKDDVVDETDEKDEVEEKKIPEEKKEEPKKEEPKKEEPKKEEDGKTEAEKAAQEQIGALEEAVHIAKDKVRADATALINPLEEERDGLLAGLEAAHKALAEEWEPVIDALLADLEATEDEVVRAAIEADIDAAENAWGDARVAAELEVDPRLGEINALFEVIETERDAEIDRLLAEFFAAVEVIENGLS